MGWRDYYIPSADVAPSPVETPPVDTVGPLQTAPDQESGTNWRSFLGDESTDSSSQTAPVQAPKVKEDDGSFGKGWTRATIRSVNLPVERAVSYWKHKISPDMADNGTPQSAIGSASEDVAFDEAFAEMPNNGWKEATGDVLGSVFHFLTAAKLTSPVAGVASADKVMPLLAKVPAFQKLALSSPRVATWIAKYPGAFANIYTAELAQGGGQSPAHTAGMAAAYTGGSAIGSKLTSASKPIVQKLAGAGVTGGITAGIGAADGDMSKEDVVNTLAMTGMGLLEGGGGKEGSFKGAVSSVIDNVVPSVKSAAVGAADTGKKWFTRHGGTGEDFHKIVMQRFGERKYQEQIVQSLGRDYGKWWKKASDGERSAVDLFLGGKGTIEDVPEQVRDTAQRMRSSLDELQLRYAESLPKDKQTDSLNKMVADSLGSYLRRQYRIFTQKEWYPQEKEYAGMREFMRETYPEMKDMPDAELDGILAKQIIELKDNGGSGRPSAGRANFDPLKSRKDIDPRVRQFYGEIADGASAWRETMSDLSWRASNMRMQRKIAEKFVLPDDFQFKPGDAENYTKLSGESFGELNGKYVPKQIAEFMTKDYGNQVSDARKLMTRVRAGLVNPFKWSKTAGNFTGGHFRQAYGNAFFAVMAGNSPLRPGNAKYYREAIRVLGDKNHPQHQQVYRDLVENGKLETEWFGNEVWRDIEREMAKRPETGKRNIVDVLNSWQNLPGFRHLGKAYGLPDQVFKVATYLKHIGEGKSPEYAMDMVDYFPNFADLPRITQLLRDVPLAGHFVSFKSEALRAGLKYTNSAIRDAKNGNYGSAAYKAMVLGAMIGGPQLAQKGINAAGGLSEENQKMIPLQKKLGPEYRRHSQSLWWDAGRPDNRVATTDIGFILPFGDYSQIASSLASGDGNTAKKMIYGNIFFDTLAALSGVDPQNPGKRVYFNVDSRAKKAEEITERMVQIMAPPIVNQVRDIIETKQGQTDKTMIQAFAPLLGVRWTDIDFDTTSSIAINKVMKDNKAAEAVMRSAYFKADTRYAAALKNYNRTGDISIIERAQRENQEDLEAVTEEFLVRQAAYMDYIESASKLHKTVKKK